MMTETFLITTNFADVIEWIIEDKRLDYQYWPNPASIQEPDYQLTVTIPAEYAVEFKLRFGELLAK